MFRLNNNNNNNNNNKKGYAYMVDVLIAVIILVVGSGFLFYSYHASTDRTTYITAQLSEDVIGVLFYTKMSDLCIVDSPCNCNPEYPTLEMIVCGPYIDNHDATLLEMISELQTKRNLPDANQKLHDMIDELFVKKVIDTKRFGFAILSDEGSNTVELYNSDN